MFSISSSGIAIKLVQRARDEDEASGSERSWKRSDEAYPRKVGNQRENQWPVGGKNDPSNAGLREFQRKKTYVHTRNNFDMLYVLIHDCASNGN